MENQQATENADSRRFKPTDYVDEDSLTTCACCIHANAVGQVAVLEYLEMPLNLASSIVVTYLARTALGVYVHSREVSEAEIKFDRLMEDLRTIMLAELEEQGYTYDPETGKAE